MVTVRRFAACRMLLAYACTERGLHRAEWRWRTDNARGSAVAARLGMSLEGVLREARLSGGVSYDKQVWSVLAGHRLRSLQPPELAAATRATSAG